MPVDYRPEDAVMCWPEADYDAALRAVEDTVSKAKPSGGGGNPMQVWTWEVFNNDGRTQQIKDYVVIPAATFKIKQLARALGKEDQFKAGRFQADDQIGCSVTVELSVESQQGYDDKNKIGKVKAKETPAAPGPYPRTRQTVTAGATPESPISGEKVFDDSDIPF